VTLMLLDSASLYFRAFHGIPETVRAPDGSPVNAVRGFLDMVAQLVRTRRPARLVACLDADWRPAFRVAALPSYKAHRVGPYGGEAEPPGLTPQVPVIEAVLAALGIAAVGVPGFEADDVIGTLAAREAEPVEVVSGDRDLFQVVRDDPAVRVAIVTGTGDRHFCTGGDMQRVAAEGTVRVPTHCGQTRYCCLTMRKAQTRVTHSESAKSGQPTRKRAIVRHHDTQAQGVTGGRCGTVIP